MNILLQTPLMMLYYQVMMGGKSYVLTVPQILKNLFMFPIESVVLTLFLSFIQPFTYRAGLTYDPQAGRAKTEESAQETPAPRFRKKDIAVLASLFLVGCISVTAYLNYYYNHTSLTVAYTTQERIDKNKQMDALLEDQAGERTKLVQGRLQDALGYTLDQMRAAYGNYSACMDLYNLPSSLMVALTASVIPAVSAAVTQRDRRQSARIVRSSLRVTALLAFPMGLGLWALSDPLFRLFYRSYNAELGGSLLAVLGIASIFVCLMLITNSILQAYGRVSVPIVTMLVGGGVKIVLNYNLVALPSVNIHGAPIGTLVCFALTALLNLIAVARIAPFRLNYPGYFLRPLFASLVMAFAARGVYALAAHFLIPSVEEVSRLTLLLCVGIAIGVAVVIYGVLVLALHCIRRSDLELLPKGDKLARLLHIS